MLLTLLALIPIAATAAGFLLGRATAPPRVVERVVVEHYETVKYRPEHNGIGSGGGGAPTVISCSCGCPYKVPQVLPSLYAAADGS